MTVEAVVAVFCLVVTTNVVEDSGVFVFGNPSGVRVEIPTLTVEEPGEVI